MIKVALLVAAIFILSLGVVSASLQFSNNFENLAEVTGDGGVVEGSATFVDGAFGNGVSLPGTHAIGFPRMDLSDKGIISFWVKPGFDTKNLAKFESIGLMDVGNFPIEDSMAAWVYKSEYGPIITFEVKDHYRRIRQVWSKRTHFNPERWHNIILVWSVNNEQGKKNYLRIYLNGKSSGKSKGKLRDVILDDMDIRVGQTGYYSGESASFDNLKVYGASSEKELKTQLKVLKKEYKAWRKLNK
jgi:hypothetical protein